MTPSRYDKQEEDLKTTENLFASDGNISKEDNSQSMSYS